MGFEVFLKGIVIGLLASIPLGPIGVMCIQRTLSKSQRSGFVSGLGAASADTLFATVALFSLTVVLSFIEDNMVIIKVLGGISVIIVGMTILLKNPVGQIRRNRAGKTSLTQDFASIFGLTIANFVLVIPYILTFFAVFKISTIETFDVAGLGRGFLVIVGFFGGAILWWTSLAFLINLFRRRFRPRHMLTINHVAGIIIGVLGVYTILSTFFNLIPHGMLQA